MRGILLLLLLLSAPAAAFAHLPPAFFVYSRLTEQKTKNTPTAITGIALTVARPQQMGTEEILGTLSLTEWRPVTDGWPTLSLIFGNNTDALLETVKAFGLTVTPEVELLTVSHEKLSAMKDAPRPFYRSDRTMQLKRTRQTYAWVHSNPKTGRSIWIEKDTFLPLKIAAPCPAGVASLNWAKAGENTCELEFRNLSALRRGNFQNARLTLWKDGAPLLFFTFDRLASGKMKLPASDGKLSPEVKEIAEALLH